MTHDSRWIYLDNHATTKVDPRVIRAMLPIMEKDYANPGSVTHEPGRHVAELVSQSLATTAAQFNVPASELVMTSGATESNNLAIFGVMLHPRQKRRKIVSMAIEHPAVLDPLKRLEKLGFEVVYAPVIANTRDGRIDLNVLESLLDDRTALVSIMMANNEIGTMQPMREISRLCQRWDIPLHCDATQAVGKIPIDLSELAIHMLSFSAHKFYGPKGIGGLVLRDDMPGLKPYPQILGGGQQQNRRSGTLNSVGIIGMATAIEIACQERESEAQRVAELRDQLWTLLNAEIDGLTCNGPNWHDESSLQSLRLAGNLNLCFPRVDGQSIMLACPNLAMSAGSACTSAEQHPSHVLLGIGCSNDQARSSLRFGIGRFNTLDEIHQSVGWIVEAYKKLITYNA